MPSGDVCLQEMCISMCKCVPSPGRPDACMYAPFSAEYENHYYHLSIKYIYEDI